MVFHGSRLVFHVFSCFFMFFHGSRCEARHETYITPKLITTRRSILGPPAEGRTGPSDDNDGDDDDDYNGMSLLSHNAYDLCHIQWTIV